MECRSLGEIVNLKVHDLSLRSKAVKKDDPKSLRVFVECREITTAAFIYAKMNGRFFDGNQVEARFYEEDWYFKGRLDL